MFSDIFQSSTWLFPLSVCVRDDFEMFLAKNVSFSFKELSVSRLFLLTNSHVILSHYDKTGKNSLKTVDAFSKLKDVGNLNKHITYVIFAFFH